MKIRFNTPENRNPDYDSGVRVQYGKGKRAIKPWRWYMILFIASAPLLYLIGFILYEIVVVKADGRITAPQIVVRSAGSGYITDILIKPLQKVNTGTILAQLENVALKEKYRRIQREIDFFSEQKNQLNLHTKELGSPLEQLAAFAQSQKSFYFDRLHRYELLFKQGAATQAEVATARKQYSSALTKLVEQEAVSNGAHTNAEIRQIATRVNQLESDLGEVESQQQQLRILSPKAGLVTEIFIQPGEFLGKGQPVLNVMMTGDVFISAFIPPKYQNYVVVGEIVTVILPNGEKAKAKIVSVPGVTYKSKREKDSLLDTPYSTILAHLKFVEPVNTQLADGLPVDIRFHHWFW